MIKIIGSHSMKVPSTEAYSSKGFAVSLEIEVADSLDGKAILQKTRQIFQLARTAVNNELRNGNADAESPSLPSTSNEGFCGNGNGQPTGGNNTNHNGNGVGTQTQNGSRCNGTPASQKQLNFVLSLAKKNGGYKNLQDLIQKRWGVGDLESLSKSQASELINEMKGGDTNGNGRR